MTEEREVTNQELGGEIMHVCQFESESARAQALTGVLYRVGEEPYRRMLKMMKLEDGVELTKWIARKK
jgi:hypothetical protein